MLIAGGAHMDPDDTQGLAHLCEHIIMGQRDFKQAVDTVGGIANANTSGEITNYYWQAPVNEGDEGRSLAMMDRFAMLFEKVNILEHLVRREVNAIDEEHIANTNNTTRILYHGCRLLANEEHPFHRFCTGNSDTILATSYTTIRKHLTDYIFENYLPKNMALVLKGPFLLINLQNLAYTTFSRIPNSNNGMATTTTTTTTTTTSSSSSTTQKSFAIVDKQFNYSTRIFQPAPRLLLIASDTNSCLRLIFPFKSSSINQLFSNAWCDIFGDERENTLCQYFHKKQFINSLVTSTSALTYDESIFIIDLDLTNRGRDRHLLEIVQSVFYYIRHLLPNVSEVAKYLSRITTINKLNFYYNSNPGSGVDEIEEIGERLLGDLNDLGLQNVIKGFGDLDFDVRKGRFVGSYEEDKNWWEKLARDFIALTKLVLSPANCKLLGMMDSAKMSSISSIATQILEEITDPYYQFDYRICEVNDAIFQSPSPDSLPLLPESLLSPLFITTTLKELNELITSFKNNPLGFQNASTLSTTTPTKISESKHHELWFRNSLDNATRHRLVVSLQWQHQTLPQSPHTTIAIELINQVIGEKLKLSLYGAEAVGVEWGLFSNLNSTNSILLTIKGLIESIEPVIQFVVDQIRNILTNWTSVVSGEEYIRARITVRKRYEELMESGGLTMATAGLMGFLEQNIWSAEDRLDELELIEFEDIDLICKSFINGISEGKFTRLLITGDCLERDCVRVANIIKKLTGGDDKNEKGNFRKSKHKSMISVKSATSTYPTPSNSVLLMLHSENNYNEPASYYIPPGKRFTFETEAHKDDPVNTILYYIQLGPRNDPYVRTMTKLFNYLLGIIALKELRERKQLGYIVINGMRIMRTTVGVYLMILSSQYTPKELMKEIEMFLLEWETCLYPVISNEVTFERQIIRPFLSLVGQYNDLIPTNLVYNLPPSVSSTNFDNENEVYLSHKNEWEKILNRTYRFGAQKGEDEIDLDIARNLKANEFWKFFRTYISIKSNVRSSLCVLLRTTMSKEEAERKIKKTQITQLLESRGIDMTSEEIDSLIDRNKGDMLRIASELGLAGGIIGKIGMKVLKIFGDSKNKSKSKLDTGQLRRLKREYGNVYKDLEPVLPEAVVDSFQDFHQQLAIIEFQ
ncbi:uncharacterized protein KQ657_000473 [Scheffersomyces spartinae]|uniref:Uncharacterized protein n=1 Tax=Scheffersomyces spartinae TaxID=45513 RepID=A0A9P7V9D5_9ASCO|nr:uncharacterized protein KQ657_000473 [Scheffersomyces spartinae]KAG7193781.1 hypothetical protein KQ657_000473 [Scheffersomyces spartinae]